MEFLLSIECSVFLQWTSVLTESIDRHCVRSLGNVISRKFWTKTATLTCIHDRISLRPVMFKRSVAPAQSDPFQDRIGNSGENGILQRLSAVVSFPFHYLVDYPGIWNIHPNHPLQQRTQSSASTENYIFERSSAHNFNSMDKERTLNIYWRLILSEIKMRNGRDRGISGRKKMSRRAWLNEQWRIAISKKRQIR